MYNLKEVYAVLEIASNVVRILVTEIHNGKLNILFSEILDDKLMINNFRIINEQKFRESVAHTFDSLSKFMHVKISHVLLLIANNDLEISQSNFELGVPSGVVQQKDLTKLNNISRHSKNNKYVIMRVPLHYKLDDKIVSNSPLHESAQKIGATFVDYKMDENLYNSYVNSLQKANLGLLNVLVSSYVTPFELNHTASLENSVTLEIFDDLSVLSFSIGHLCKVITIPFGDSIIDDAVAEKLFVTHQQARVYRRAFVNFAKFYEKSIVYRAPDPNTGATLETSVKQLNEIVFRKLIVIFDKARTHLRDFEKKFRFNPLPLYVLQDRTQTIGLLNILQNYFSGRIVKTYSPQVTGATHPCYTNGLGSCRYYHLVNAATQFPRYSVVPYTSNSLQQELKVNQRMLNIGLIMNQIGKKIIKS